MTALRLNLRVFVTGPGLPAAAGLAALILAAAILTVWASIRSGIPIQNVMGVMLLVLALGGSGVTTLMLSPRSRPALPRRAVDVPVEALSGAPGTWMPAPVRAGGARGAGAGIPQRPAADRPPTLTAAGPAPGGA